MRGPVNQEKVMHDAVLEEILSHLPVGSTVERLEEQLLKIARRQERGEIFQRAFPIHPQYGYSRKLLEHLDMLHLGGALINSGLDFQYEEITPWIQRQARKYAHQLTDQERQELKEIAAEIAYAPPRNKG
ncbi:MAG: hypothetical protein Q8R53_01655 [Nanoarchaeota archaeon]|nr:hypothetical protein [Nanoarchaeota archaeon]